MAISRIKVSYEDYLSMAEDVRPCEVVDGELHMPPAPGSGHQRLVGRLFSMLDRYVRQHRLGEVLIAPLDVVLDRSRPLIVQPDLMFIDVHRASMIGARIEGAPDLVIEVLSAATRVRDRFEKATWYSHYGAREYWIVDPEEKTIEARRLLKEGFELIGTFGRGETFQSEVIDGLRVDVSAIFD